MINLSIFFKFSHQRIFRILFLTLFIVSISVGLLIVPIEHKVGKIKTNFDGIWWAMTTITTVGYGDYVPVTVLGRILAMFLEIVGVILYGSLIATVSMNLNRKQEEFWWSRLFDRLNRIEEDLTDLKRKTDFWLKEQKTTKP